MRPQDAQPLGFQPLVVPTPTGGWTFDPCAHTHNGARGFLERWFRDPTARGAISPHNRAHTLHARQARMARLFPKTPPDAYDAAHRRLFLAIRGEAVYADIHAIPLQPGDRGFILLSEPFVTYQPRERVTALAFDCLGVHGLSIHMGCGVFHLDNGQPFWDFHTHLSERTKSGPHRINAPRPWWTPRHKTIPLPAGLSDLYGMAEKLLTHPPVGELHSPDPKRLAPWLVPCPGQQIITHPHWEAALAAMGTVCQTLSPTGIFPGTLHVQGRILFPDGTVSPLDVEAHSYDGRVSAHPGLAAIMAAFFAHEGVPTSYQVFFDYSHFPPAMTQGQTPTLTQRAIPPHLQGNAHTQMSNRKRWRDIALQQGYGLPDPSWLAQNRT